MLPYACAMFNSWFNYDVGLAVECRKSNLLNSLVVVRRSIGRSIYSPEESKAMATSDHSAGGRPSWSWAALASGAWDVHDRLADWCGHAQ